MNNPKNIWYRVSIAGFVACVLGAIISVTLAGEPTKIMAIFLLFALLLVIVSSHFENQLNSEKREQERIEREKLNSNKKGVREFAVLVVVLICTYILSYIASTSGDGGILGLFLVFPIFIFTVIRGLMLLARIISDSYYRRKHSDVK